MQPQYPVAAVNYRGKTYHQGFASTAKEAHAIYTTGTQNPTGARMDPDKAAKVGLPKLADIECAFLNEDSNPRPKGWERDIDAGYATVRVCGGPYAQKQWYAVYVTTWTFDI